MRWPTCAKSVHIWAEKFDWKARRQLCAIGSTMWGTQDPWNLISCFKGQSSSDPFYIVPLAPVSNPFVVGAWPLPPCEITWGHQFWPPLWHNNHIESKTTTPCANVHHLSGCQSRVVTFCLIGSHSLQNLLDGSSSSNFKI